MPKRMPKLQLLVGALATLATRATPQEEPPFPPGGGWLPLVYEKTADGYDNHDPKYLNKGECLPGSTVQLRGHIQCTSGNQECWKDAAVGPGFATVPAACRPGGTVTSTPAKIDGSASGYTTDGPSPALIVDSSGVMSELHHFSPHVDFQGSPLTVALWTALSAAAGDHWVLHLSGVTYDGASDWGLFFLITLAVCAVGYVGGGVGYVHKTQGAAPALTAHPHFPYWQQV